MKTHVYYDYFPLNQWEVEEEITCHYFDSNETPFQAVRLKVGNVCTVAEDDNGTKHITKTPVIRWMSRETYDKERSEAYV